MMTSLADAQLDMRSGYYGGWPGIIVSGSAWFAAALVALFVGPRPALATLIIGGMFIFPLSVLLGKIIGCAGTHQKGNPLAPLAIYGTIWMVLSIPIAVGAALTRIEWFFPAMLLVIGSRYLTFATIYGMRVYLIFGAVLIAAGVVTGLTSASVFIGALAGALIEYVFGVLIFMQHRSLRHARNPA